MARRRRTRIKPMATVSFGDIRELEGAVKVCVRYGKKTPTSLTRCLQWSAGPGYAEGPVERGNLIESKYFIQEARVREDGTPIARPYRYRQGKNPLPYPPRTVKGGQFNPNSVRTQERWDNLPDPVKAKIVQIIDRGTVKPLGPEELVLLPSAPPRDTES